MDAALKLFVTLGFHATPTSMVAKEAGVANGTLFHYFSTKEDLIIVLYKEIKTKFAIYINDSAKDAASFKETMRGQYLSSLFWALGNREGFKYIEQFTNSPYLALIEPLELLEQIKPHTDLLQKGIDEGIICNKPTDYLFMLISSITYGLNNFLIANNFGKEKEHQLISDTFDLIWEMIKKQAP